MEVIYFFLAAFKQFPFNSWAQKLKEQHMHDAIGFFPVIYKDAF